MSVNLQTVYKYIAAPLEVKKHYEFKSEHVLLTIVQRDNQYETMLRLAGLVFDHSSTCLLKSLIWVVNTVRSQMSLQGIRSIYSDIVKAQDWMDRTLSTYDAESKQDVLFRSDCVNIGV